MTNDPSRRTALLQRINVFLGEYGVPAWGIEMLGDRDKGQCEIVELADAAEISAKRVELGFRVRNPDGAEHVVKLRFGGRVTFVIPYLSLLDGEDAGRSMVCLAKRWRIERGGWSYELPRALIHDDEHEGAEHPQLSPAHVALGRTFGGELLDGLTAARVLPLGDVPLKGEGSPAAAYLLVASLLGRAHRKRGDGEAVKLEWRAAMRLVEDGTHVSEPCTVALLHRAAGRYRSAFSKDGR